VERQPVPCDAASYNPPGAAVELVDPQALLEEAQAAVRRLEAGLIAAQRLALLGTMSAMIAHEIKNLVTPVLGGAEFALRTREPGDMQKALERARTQAQKLGAVAERLLRLARNEPVPLESCAVADAVREALETATRSFAKDGIEVVVAVPQHLRVRAQAGLFEQVLLNLLLNARQAMQGRRGRLEISAVRDGECVIIDVRDNGVGIPPERLEHVINPFLAGADLQEPLAWQPVGLGLNVCRIITSKHGATIQARPHDGQGCTFRVHWPAGEEVS